MSGEHRLPLPLEKLAQAPGALNAVKAEHDRSGLGVVEVEVERADPAEPADQGLACRHVRELFQARLLGPATDHALLHQHAVVGEGVGHALAAGVAEGKHEGGHREDACHHPWDLDPS